MPNGHESDGGGGGGGGGGVKKRQTPARSYSGYTTDESAASYGGPTTNNSNHNPESKGGSGSKKDKDRKRSGESGGHGGGRRNNDFSSPDKYGGKASVIWMVLAIGLLFCMLDAMYIVRVLDRGHAETNEAETSNDHMVQQFRRVSKDLFVHKDNQLSSERGGGGGGTNHIFGKKSSLTASERAARKKKKEEEAKKAEEDRIRKIKMAALEALKAENGGKIPENADLENDEAFTPRPMSYYKERAIIDDKDRILQLFREAGLKEMDDSTYAVLPAWNEVARLYGKEPKIVGLEQCETFQKKGNPWEHFVSTAGTFNSGTNLMAELLIHNCHMQARMEKLGAKNRGIRWQVPWGKHTPPGDEEYRLEHKSKKDADVDANMILPAVTVRDPYYWMQSMCKHHYTASWRNTDRCPNLTPSEKDKANFPMLRDKDFFPLSVRYSDFRKHHESLTGLWNDWYNEYRNVEFQRLFVRYEDLLFHPKNVTETVCKCAGGQMNRGGFQYVVDSAKKGVGAHGKIRTGYIDAIIKYGSERHRYNGYHPEDLAYARKKLDSSFMEQLGYKYHPMSLETNNENKDAGEKNAGNEHEDEHEVDKEEHEAPELPQDEEEEAPEAEESADIGDKEDKEAKSSDEEEKPDAEESADLGDKADVVEEQ